MIYVIATMTLKPGKADDVRAAAQGVLAGTRAEPGCIRYDLHQDIDDPDKMVFVEQWESREALDRHMSQPHVLSWREKALPLIERRVIQVIAPESVETL